jgi:hypothetical protein
MKNKNLIIAGLVIVLLILGWFLPLGSYTTTKGCPVDPTPTERLHLIFGDSIQKIKDSDIEPTPNIGCAVNTKYVLYFL